MWTDKERADGCLGALRMIERIASDEWPNGHWWEALAEISRLSTEALREYEPKPEEVPK